MGDVVYLTDLQEKNKRGEGSITRKNGSRKLYVDFYYYGERIEKSTGKDDTPENRLIVRRWLDDQLKKIDEGIFKFSEAFPGASEKEKRLFAQKEGWDYHPEPQRILFEDYSAEWMRKFEEDEESLTKKQDFEQNYNYWILPYFAGKTFYQITATEMKQFLGKLKWKEGKNTGKRLSRSRVKNILIPLRAIWNDACDENHWQLPDPFRNLHKKMPQKVKKPPKVFRFEEWVSVIENIDPFYRDVAEVMMMTGMIGSEIAGLKKEHIYDGLIHVQDSIVRKVERVGMLKTEHRKREVLISQALKERLDAAIERSTGRYVFSMEDGRRFNINSFRKTPWSKAILKAGVKYRDTYTMRHSFAMWCLVGGIHPERLVGLLGHGSKQMVYEVYGKYVQGVEKDAGLIRGYFGNDFFGL
jgi:integrase